MRACITGILLLAIGGHAMAQEVTVTWDKVADSRVAGYEIHYGTASKSYSGKVETQANTQTLSGLTPGQTYFIAVRAFNQDRSLVSGFSNEITTTIPESLTPPTTITASFTPSALSGSSPLTVTFQNTSAGPITRWQWSFGDGKTSTAASPSYTYKKSGTFLVSLVASGEGGASATASAQISISGRARAAASSSSQPLATGGQSQAAGGLATADSPEADQTEKTALRPSAPTHVWIE